MKGIPLWQPWASLVAIGAKRNETRHWEAPAWIIGTRVVIHATKTRRCIDVIDLEPFRRRLDRARAGGTLALVDGELPLGALVATAVVEACFKVTRQYADWLKVHEPDEAVFGNYDVGRYVWRLRKVRPLVEPVPFTGRQGIFEVPDELVVAG